MKHIKRIKVFESDNEIPWKIFEEFIHDCQDVFVEIMDDDLSMSEYGKYSIEYQDDFIFLKFRKPEKIESIVDLYKDINIAILRLSEKYNISNKMSDVNGLIKIVLT